MCKNDAVLEEYWAKGLTGTGTTEQKLLADELSAKTGLSVVQIQVPETHFISVKLAISNLP